VIRFITSLVLLLGPYFYGFVPLLGRSGESCSMACCKKAKRCCHETKSSENGEPRWSAARTCPPSCGMQLAAPAATPALPTEHRTIHSIPSARASLNAHATTFRTFTRFTLFARPPPILL
jgi:hypothetical protein